MPVVSLQGPIEHHQTTGQSAVGERPFHTEALGAVLEGGLRFLAERPGRFAAELTHHHPGGGLNRLLMEESLPIQPALRRRAGFIPGFPRFPSPAPGGFCCSDQFAQITAVNPLLALDRSSFSADLHLDGTDAVLLALNILQAAARPPLERPCLADPTLQQLFGLFRPEAEAADPVVVQAVGGCAGEGADELTPQSRLPAAEFMAIRCTDPRRAEHAAEPWTGGEQQGPGTTARCLDRSSHTAASPSPDHDIPDQVVTTHG